ncbi:hypothetical protein DQ238_14285 [Geodermatophilus sp. TF02-6]|nr:hypothetical protein DQ238_14285 [Geodermatophilus sp. TF02-6]
MLAAARLHLVNPLQVLGIPWGIVALSFGVNLVIWALTDVGSQPTGGFTAGVVSLYITVTVIFALAVTQLLPFAMGISLSRRTFYLGTALVAVAQSLWYGVLLSVLTAIEDATGGWGVGLDYFAPAGLDVDNAALQIPVSGAPMLAFAFAGVGMGVIAKRWGPAGIWYGITGAIVVFGGLAILFTWRRAWDDLGRWLTEQSVPAVAVVLPVVVAGVFAVVAWVGLRRVVR